MSDSSTRVIGKAIRAIVVFTPWVLASYVFYWLDSSGTWTIDTPHRGKLSVAILSAGMLASLLIRSYFLGREKK